MMVYRNLGKRSQATPQTEAIPDSNQQANHGGGFSHVIDDMFRLKRFLVIGSADNTFYVAGRTLAKENLECLERLLVAGRGKAAIDLIVEISTSKRAAKNDQALFALARCCGCDVHGGLLVQVPQEKTYTLHRENHPDLEKRFNQQEGVVTLSEGGKKAWTRKGDTLTLTVYKGAKQVQQVHPLDLEIRQYAYAALSKVARTGAHFLLFQSLIEQFRGRGAMQQKATNVWYEQKSLMDIAYQVAKYRNRSGFAQRDVLRLLHPKTTDAFRNELYRWMVKGEISYAVADVVSEIPAIDVPELASMVPEDGQSVSSTSERTKLTRQGFMVVQTLVDPLRQIRALERVKRAEDVHEITNLIHEYHLTWEMIPSEMLNAQVWEALLEHMPMEAMVKNLATLTRLGVLTHFGKWTALVDARLRDAELIEKSGLHPMKILTALHTYSMGHGIRSKATWTPLREIVDGLNEAFYLTFKNVVPSGKRLLLGIDVSGSMATGDIGGVKGLTPRVVSAALALITMATEPHTEAMAFSHDFIPLPISPRQRLDDVIDAVSGLGYSDTDCARPITWALEHKISVDSFVVYTDNETNFTGKWVNHQFVPAIHPSQALQQYRREMGIDAKLVVVAMTSTEFSIADPKDPGMLDCVGMDANAPAMISEFIKGGL
jgi:60 kDa SS-A/Ro ribonucleoprotein